MGVLEMPTLQAAVRMAIHVCGGLAAALRTRPQLRADERKTVLSSGSRQIGALTSVPCYPLPFLPQQQSHPVPPPE